jgi:hypothetical protein
MEVVAEAHDRVHASFLLALLRDAGLTPALYDGYMAALLGGAVIPWRIAVAPDSVVQARRVLREAGEAAVPR